MSQTTISIHHLVQKKHNEAITMLTAYDYPTAVILDRAGIDILLIGDSVGNVVYGQPDTLGVTVADIIRHSQAVARGAQRALVVADMPFGSYQACQQQAVENATMMLAQGRAHAVKLEGGRAMADTIARLVSVGIPVMAHVGLTPQSVHQIGGYRMMGKSDTEAELIHQDALAVERAGAFAVVLECVEPKLADNITQALTIPTIGIGSGPNCDGQVLVTNDLIGLTVSHVPRFVEPVCNVSEMMAQAAIDFINRTKKSEQ